MTECTLHRHCTLTSFLPYLLSFSVCPQTDTAELYNTQSDLCIRTPHLDRIGFLCSIMFADIIVIFMTSHMIRLLISYKVAKRSLAKLQVHRDHRSTKDSQVHSEYEFGACVVDMHVLPIKGTAQVKFKVLDGTEPTLSMPMLVANGVILRGEVATLSTAKGETAPLMNAGND